LTGKHGFDARAARLLLASCAAGAVALAVDDAFA
jgi:hypothetical protein